MSQQSAIQSTLHLNRRIITDLIASQKLDKALCQGYFKLSDRNDHRRGAEFFDNLNQTRDKIRDNKRRLKQLAEVQVALKKILKG